MRRFMQPKNWYLRASRYVDQNGNLCSRRRRILNEITSTAIGIEKMFGGLVYNEIQSVSDKPAEGTPTNGIKRSINDALEITSLSRV